MTPLPTECKSPQTSKPNLLLRKPYRTALAILKDTVNLSANVGLSATVEAQMVAMKLATRSTSNQT